MSIKIVKKKKGSVSKFGIPLFTIVAIFAILTMVITYLSDVDKKDTVDIIAREYLLRMEADGYLNSADENDLLEDLANCGMKNISLTGTTKSRVGYGKKITIAIQGQIEITSYTVEDLFKITKTPKLIDVNIKPKSSTAKY